MAAGLDSCPRRSQIFAERVRQKICHDKAVPTATSTFTDRASPRHAIDVTMLYSHIETIQERVDHMLRARWDETGGRRSSARIPPDNNQIKLPAQARLIARMPSRGSCSKHRAHQGSDRDRRQCADRAVARRSRQHRPEERFTTRGSREAMTTRDRRLIKPPPQPIERDTSTTSSARLIAERPLQPDAA
jgi:hypothetical protein